VGLTVATLFAFRAERKNRQRRSGCHPIQDTQVIARIVPEKADLLFNPYQRFSIGLITFGACFSPRVIRCHTMRWHQWKGGGIRPDWRSEFHVWQRFCCTCLKPLHLGI